MKERELALEIVTPEGMFLSQEGVRELVVRRLEKNFEPGSEVAVFPLHAPMLVRTQGCKTRYLRRGRLFCLITGGGFLQVKDGRVLLLITQVNSNTGTFVEPG